jgi:hypothetical protein
VHKTVEVEVEVVGGFSLGTDVEEGDARDTAPLQTITRGEREAKQMYFEPL